MKPTPLMTTVAPGAALVGLMLVIASGTVKLGPLSAVPAIVVSAIFPVVAPGGTVAFTCVALTGVMPEASTPLNVTAVGPVRLAPLMVTTVPATPLAGVKLAIVGGRMTVKLGTLVPVPAGVVTDTLFVTAVNGTDTVMCESSFTTNPGATTDPNFTAVAPVKVDPSI
jgi:hypothetical protein